METKSFTMQNTHDSVEIMPEQDGAPSGPADLSDATPLLVKGAIASYEMSEPAPVALEPGLLVGTATEVPTSETGTPQGVGATTAKPKKAKAETAMLGKAKLETAKSDTAKTDTAKADTAKTDTAKTDTAKTDTAKPEALKSEIAKTKIAKPDKGKSETAKRKMVKPKAAKHAGAKSGTPKGSAAKDAALAFQDAHPKKNALKGVRVKGVKPKVAKKLALKVVKGTLETESPFDLSDSQWYLNRELTWLEFNRRVLHESIDERTPLLERLKFIAIVSANIDEFIMKRIGGLKQQIGAGMHDLTLDGRTPRQQVVECHASIREIHARKRESFLEVLALLEQKGIVIERWDTLIPKEKKYLREHYYTNIYPLLTPQSIDPAHPFPFISNLSLNLLVTLRYPRAREVSLARVKVPLGLGSPRFIRVGKGDHFITLEEVMMNNLDMLFPGMHIVACEIFRVTRNANTEKDEEEADDLMAMIESELKERRFAPIVRLEVGSGMEPLHRGRLAAELELDEENDVFEVPGMLAMRDLFEISRLDFPRMHDPAHHPIDHPQLLTTRNIFHTIRDAGQILLQHPYVSFSTSIERFLREAANDPKVRGIKMTLYRTSSQSRIIDALLAAG